MDPVVVNVAQIRRSGAPLEIIANEVTDVYVPAGGSLALRAHFTYTEASGGKEAFMVRVSGNLAGQEPAPAEQRIADRPILDDSALGFVSQTFSDLPEGRHVLEAVIDGEYRVGDWQGTTGEPEQQQLRVKIPVLVGAAH